ncbi:MAG: hypothetical protein V1911_03865 [Candidatus Micrarchaeota archaeon]
MASSTKFFADEEALEQEELVQLREALQLLEQAKECLLKIKEGNFSSGFYTAAYYFAEALKCLEGSGGAIIKIKAAQSYAHQMLSGAAKGNSPALINASRYVSDLDKRIEVIEGQLIIFLDQSLRYCETNSLRQDKIQKAAKKAISRYIDPLISLLKKYIKFGLKVFKFEEQSSKKKRFGLF